MHDDDTPDVIVPAHLPEGAPIPINRPPRKDGTFTSERAKAAARARWDRQRERSTDDFASLTPSEQQRAVRDAMKELGVQNATDLAALASDPAVFLRLCQGVATQMLLRVLTDDYVPKSAGEAMRVAEGAFKLARLTEGKPTEIGEDFTGDLAKRLREFKERKGA